ncbi:alpha/beta hydrolase [Salinactinospora qingdaonensis]|uniref:Alpha/beta fold hydrolase n=1 Tax=Salinactinospora qingdaonensis TaxID=702744 RepID=A0ABP7EVG3_9ACTN
MSRSLAVIRRCLVLALGCLALFVTGCAPQGDPPSQTTSPAPAPAVTEHDITFTSGPDTLHGTFAVPDNADGPLPGALIISGSGPTDRDGNSEARPNADTNANLARVLAQAGVASLRYDKLGSGETGHASRSPDEPVGYDVFESEMIHAYARLASQPEIDTSRLLVVGHSEGSIFALRSTHVIDEHPPTGLILVAPVGDRYLDLIDRQLTERIRTAESQGALDAPTATKWLSDTRYSVARLRAGESLPEDLPPQIEPLFNPSVAPFLRQIDAMDPVRLAQQVPSEVNSLVLWGTADSQVTESEVDRLMTGLSNARRVDLEGADHILRMYDDSPGAAVLDEDRPFSPDVAPAVRRFLNESL